ncbi:MAG: hypothetical protein JWN99_2340 [Ilumatobacteraceae bacterium]|nr:hypothetical protein [Ilumatobacteraceae bacterium]
MSKIDDATAWQLIHSERRTVADMLETLTAEQWAAPSLCGSWTVQQTAGHMVTGAEQTTGHFMSGMVKNAFRFNTMMDRDARREGARPPADLVERLRARLTTTNRPPAPAITMLGEIVVHGQDVSRPLGLDTRPSAQAVIACLEMYKDASFPVGAKKRIAGLRLRATDVDWSHGAGPEVSGPGVSLLMVMTGRADGVNALQGDGLPTLKSRMA